MNLSQKVSEVDSVSRNVGGLQERVNTLSVENKSLIEELRVAKEGIRNSTVQTSHIGQENELLKRRIIELENSNRRIS